MTGPIVFCDVCGEIIAFGKMHITHPKLNEHMHPQKIDFETWCSACHRAFYEMYNEWRVEKALSNLNKRR